MYKEKTRRETIETKSIINLEYAGFIEENYRKEMWNWMNLNYRQKSFVYDFTAKIVELNY
ncbi:hypothetical protein DRQ07_02470 [candidate division KSB1 bacterium]|nr:MAG: hypothetical protein DRQ07_02470 [candidate division KSB1 bacterium]